MHNDPRDITEYKSTEQLWIWMNLSCKPQKTNQSLPGEKYGNSLNLLLEKMAINVKLDKCETGHGKLDKMCIMQKNINFQHRGFHLKKIYSIMYSEFHSGFLGTKLFHFLKITKTCSP